VATETVEAPPKSMFCEVDRAHLVDPDTGSYRNHIASSYPAYMNKHAIEEMEQEADTMVDSLGDGRVDPSAIEFYKRKVTKQRKRLDDIKQQTPKFTGSEMTHIKDSFIDLENQVRPALFTEKDMETGKGVDVAEEARRMSLEPTIPIDKWLAESCNVTVTEGKCTRSEAEKALIIANWHLTGGDKTYLIDNLRRKQGGSQAKPDSVSMSSIPAERYDMAFGGEAFSRLEAKLKALETRLEEKTKPKEYPEWKCEEEGCDFVGTTKNKGIHKALHVRKANIKAKELADKE